MSDKTTRTHETRGWRELVRELEEAGDATIDDLDELIAEVSQMRAEMRYRARHATAQTAASQVRPSHDVPARTTEVEREPDRRVSFDEATSFLHGRLDLEAARIDAMKSHGRWGLVDAVVRTGAINYPSQYGRLFNNNATVNLEDLRQVRERIKCGEKFTPIFDPGVKTLWEMFDILFTRGGIPRYGASSGIHNLYQLRKIDTKTIPNLDNLALASTEVQHAAFITAYYAASPLAPTGPRVIFTPDTKEVSWTSTSATEQLQLLDKGGIKFLDPIAHFLLFRTQVDAGLRALAEGTRNFDDMHNDEYREFLEKAFADQTIYKHLPDLKKTILYPDYVYEIGRVCGFSVPKFLDSKSHKVEMDFHYPDHADSNTGSRIALG